MSSQYDRRLYQLVGAFYRRFDYPKGVWRLLRLLLAAFKGRSLIVGESPARIIDEPKVFRLDAEAASIENLGNELSNLTASYILIAENSSLLSEEISLAVAIMEAEGLGACWFSSRASEAAIGSIWRIGWLQKALRSLDSRVPARRFSFPNITLPQPSLIVVKKFEKLSAFLISSADYYVATPVGRPFENRNFPSIAATGANVAVVAPWFDHAGSSILTADLFTHPLFKDFFFTSVALKDHDSRHNTLEGLRTFKSFSYDLENLGVYEPYDRRADLLIELFTYWKPDVLFNANCADLYRNLKSIKSYFPRLKVVDHLFNTSWHFDQAVNRQNYIDLFIVANEQVRMALVAGGVQEKKIKIIYHGIDTKLFSPDPVLKSTGRIFTAGFIGRLSPEKRPLDFIQALARMSEGRGIISGDGVLKSEMLGEIQRLGLTNRIEIRYQPRGPKLYEDIDVLVIASEFEGLPMVVLEALAMGIPVVATPVGAIPKVVSSKVFGSLFPIGDVSELTKCLESIRDNLERVRNSARDRRALIETEYSLNRCAAAYRYAFDSLINGP